MKSPHVLSIGWAHVNANLIETILRKVEDRTNLVFYHIVTTEVFQMMSSDSYYQGRIFKFPVEKDVLSSIIDLEYLAELEKGSELTINNLILSDRVLRHLPYDDALAYCYSVVNSIQKVIEEVKPTFILGSWDSVIPGLTSMLAKKAGIPFYTTKFSVIPHKEVTFCEYPYQDREFETIKSDKLVLEERAANYLNSWLDRVIVAPAYASTNSILDIFKRLPFYFNALMIQIFLLFRGGKNKYSKYSVSKNIAQFSKKKLNLILRRDKYFIKDIPSAPFFFYGLHMQPESSIDVWAPFYSNQYQVIESIARSMPLGHLLCVKIHISDADNYSNKDIQKLLKMPGVKVVSPHVSSREFIEKASIIFSIQGTIGLEGALLGKPVIMFGESAVLGFSTAKKVISIESLPELVRDLLQMSTPSKEKIISDYAIFLRNYLPASSDDWAEVVKQGLSDVEVENYVNIFNNLLNFTNNNNSIVQI
jgi:hypothetical protein